MESVRLSLCPACDACPKVEVDGEAVRIGETSNEVVLRKDEWNVLVDLIHSERLTRL